MLLLPGILLFSLLNGIWSYVVPVVPSIYMMTRAQQGLLSLLDNNVVSLWRSFVSSQNVSLYILN